MSRFWTLLPHFRGGRTLSRRNLRGAFAALCLILLASCGESSPRGYAGSASSETLQPVVAPPGANESPPLPGTTGAAKTADGLPVLGSKGVNTALFASKLDDENARLDRLENSVQELRNDFDAITPSIMRLISIEGDIQNLIAQLDVLTGKAPDTDIAPIDETALEAEPVQPAAVPLPPKPDHAQAVSDQTAAASDQAGAETSSQGELSPPTPIQPQTDAQASAAAPVSGSKPETGPSSPASPSPAPAAESMATPSLATPPPAAKANPVAVQALRVGEHPGKVRIVLDIKGKTAFTADLDNAEKIFVIELPSAAWEAKNAESFAKNPVLVSYKTESMGKEGTRLILKLKAKTSIIYKGAMDDAASSGSKIVIDLAAP